MSIALESSNPRNRIQRPAFDHGMPCISIYDSPEPAVLVADRGFQAAGDSDSCSSSSIGRNSDVFWALSDGDDGGESEVQSSYKGPLDTMDALEEVLPMKKGISKFYSGKSKSFTSLAEISSSSSTKDLAKPENAYSRKRKNLLAHNNLCEKNHNFPQRSNAGGMLKKPANFSRNKFSPAENKSNSGCDSSGENSSTSSPSPPQCLPPLHPHGKRLTSSGSTSSLPQRSFPSWRSFSLSDLQSVAAASPNLNGLVNSNRDD
ncbi:protein OXIDATIVE STRESS 3 LIKE 2-like [Malania oleifera]|uniref:protein OXIDATIVE STRESS 3 LIKE 2-like n=1 Tax=Malania oleifera TaxID=397392 RepID=UPI0025AE803F|nr:protein OXIDATIVE STRESS 3 LIKE 2-like [Malania oleifera]